MEKITDHLTYREATFSMNATKHGIDNTPTAEQLTSIQKFAEHVFEPLRKLSGDKTIRTSIIFRSGVKQKSAITGKITSVNELAGGDPNSQHKCENGDAAGDFDNDGLEDRVQNNVLFKVAYNHLEVNYDKIIAENIDDSGHVDWVHISHNHKRKQRRIALVMFFCMVNGKRKKVYRIYDVFKGLVRSNYLLNGEL